MTRSKTFEEIFEQLYYLYKGKQIQVQVKKSGLTLSDFSIYVKDLQINPIKGRQLRQQFGLQRGEKLGAIVFKGCEKPGGSAVESLNIPFKLGYDTMQAYFVRKKVSIESCGFEFQLRQQA